MSHFRGPDGTALPLDFIDAEYLIALGVAHWEQPPQTGQHEDEDEDDEQCDRLPPRPRPWQFQAADPGAEPALYLDALALAGYVPPVGATDDLVLTADDTSTARLRHSPTGTRIAPTAAYCLWAAREELERDGLLSASGWCSRCGRHFLDRRAHKRSASADPEPMRRLGCLRIPQHCSACRKLRTKRLPPVRQCAARDCERWFQPTDGKQVFHSPACGKAEGRGAVPGAPPASLTG